MEVRKLVLSGNSLQKYAACQPLSPGCINGAAHDYKPRTFSRCVQPLSSSFSCGPEPGLDKTDYLWPYCNHLVRLEFPTILMAGEEAAAEGGGALCPSSKQCRKTPVMRRANRWWRSPRFGHRLAQTVLILSLL